MQMTRDLLSAMRSLPVDARIRTPRESPLLARPSSKPAGVPPSASRRLAAPEKRVHPLQRLQDILRRVGVGNADIALGEDAKVRPADGGDAGVIEQRGR